MLGFNLRPDFLRQTPYLDTPRVSILHSAVHTNIAAIIGTRRGALKTAMAPTYDQLSQESFTVRILTSVKSSINMALLLAHNDLE